MAEESVTVVTGTLSVFGHFAFTLFDSCSTHSFISVGFAKKALLGLKPLTNVLLVFISLEKLLKVTYRVKIGRVTISGREFDVVLILLAMVDFDIYFGYELLECEPSCHCLQVSNGKLQTSIMGEPGLLGVVK